MVADIIVGLKEQIDCDTYPKEPQREIEEIVDTSYRGGYSNRASTDPYYLDHLMDEARQATKINLYLLDNKEYGCFVTYYGIADPLQHYYWKQTLPESGSALVPLRQEILGIYRELNQLLAN